MKHPFGSNLAFWSFWDDFFEMIGRELFPIWIWLFLTFHYMMGLTEKPAVRIHEKAAGRNAPCPCGSGRKYKWCCGNKA
ncbi:MAG: SEC-C domain-containing protein [Acidobacteria bacterium]|nr:SEC-C domain-containing protein [Acidobacteriota bacterium]